jgi:translation initiation factor 1
VSAPGRLVYSSGKGPVCPACGWPQNDCHCSKTLATGAEPLPETVTVTLRLENRASGKHVTVLDGLPDNRAFLDRLCRDLKKACGAGGAAGERAIELQGDHRERLRDLLARKGMRVKG